MASTCLCAAKWLAVSLVSVLLQAVPVEAAPVAQKVADKDLVLRPEAASGAAKGTGPGPAAPVGMGEQGKSGQDISRPVPPPPPTTLEEVKAGMARGETRQYECAYVLPKGEAAEFPFCPKDGSASTTSRSVKELTPENGDIVVVVKAADYFAALRAMDGKLPQLSLNGLSMAGSAKQVGWSQNDTHVQLSFSVTQVDSQDARTFWSTTYQRVGFRALTPLYVTLGWSSNPSYFRPNTENGIPDVLYITSKSRMFVAGGLGLAILLGFLWAMHASDIFRTGPRLESGARQAYSFARVQWGVWTTFAIASAVFLWAVFGIFPALTSTVLAMAGVSTLTATTSFFMDSGKQATPQLSRNLWSDLLSGANETTAQAHRFQALAVNTVLLISAAYYVYQHLDYPTFDPTWLAMLGISNAGLLAGKQALERDESEGLPRTPPLASTSSGSDGASSPVEQAQLPPPGQPAQLASPVQPSTQPATSPASPSVGS